MRAMYNGASFAARQREASDEESPVEGLKILHDRDDGEGLGKRSARNAAGAIRSTMTVEFSQRSGTPRRDEVGDCSGAKGNTKDQRRTRDGGERSSSRPETVGETTSNRRYLATGRAFCVSGGRGADHALA